ncbi:MAG TPA: hypothetical protein VKN99_15845 [Polyangia bacterium]|nr:hypothetical protein [Polyangia bacterium]
MRLRTGPDCDLSVILAVGDDEDRVGHAIRKIAGHLRALERSFELLAVDEQSADNSLALLALLRPEIPELQVLTGADPGTGFACGVAAARGRALLLVDPRREVSLAPVVWALGRIDAGRDAVVLPGRYVVARRLPAWSALAQARGRGDDFERAFARKARAARLNVETPRLARESRWRALAARLGWAGTS